MGDPSSAGSDSSLKQQPAPEQGPGIIPPTSPATLFLLSPLAPPQW
jgi:hypothetical protein